MSIDSVRSLTSYDRMIFGGFLEHFHRQIYGGIFDPGSPLAGETGFRTDVMAAVREMGVTNVRWPGGLFVDDCHWQDGVGPERPATLSRRWGVEEPNTFGTDEFVTWCRLVGAEPYICTNASTGTLEEMADWVAYCNVRDKGRFARRLQRRRTPRSCLARRRRVALH